MKKNKKKKKKKKNGPSRDQITTYTKNRTMIKKAKNVVEKYRQFDSPKR